MMSNLSKEKFRLYNLILAPDENGLDAETVHNLEDQLDLMCGLQEALVKLKTDYLRILFDCYLDRGFGLETERRRVRRSRLLTEALDDLCEAMSAQPRDLRYYTRWRARQEASEKGGGQDGTGADRSPGPV